MMKKRVALGLITAMALSTSVALASPMDMEEGKTNLYFGWTFGGNTDLGGQDGKIDGDVGAYLGATYGINDKWGVQLDFNNYAAEEKISRGLKADMDVDVLEVNAVYKIDQNLNAFVGYVDADAELKATGLGSVSADTDGVHLGVMGSYPLSDKWGLFGKVALGNNSEAYELGVSYNLSDKWGMDLSYRDAEYKDLRGSDIEVKGIRLGATTRF